MLDTAMTILQRANGPAGWYASVAQVIASLGDEAEPRLSRLLELALDARTPGPVVLAIARALPEDRPRFAEAVVRAARDLPPGSARVELLSHEPGFDRRQALDELAERAGDRMQGQLLALARLLDHLARRGDEDTAEAWLDELGRVARDTPALPRIHAGLVGASVLGRVGRGEDAEREFRSALHEIRACEDEQTLTWLTAHLIRELLRRVVERSDPLLEQALAVVGDWPPAPRDRLVQGLCGDLSERKLPLERVASLLSRLELSLQTRSVLESAMAVEEARLGNVRGCLARLEAGIALRAQGSPVELQDVVGDLPSGAPLPAVAHALADAGVLEDAAMAVGGLARHVTDGAEALRWIDIWSVVLARHTDDDGLLHPWLAEGRRVVDEIPLPDLPHIPLETLGTLAVLEIRRGDAARGEWLLRGLERRASSPTDHVLAARRMRALAGLGRFEALADADRLPDHVQAMLAEDLVSDGLPRPAAIVLEGIRSHWASRIFHAVEARCTHHGVEGDGWEELAKALGPALPHVPDHDRFRCQVTFARLCLYTSGADEGRVALRRLAIRALEEGKPPHLYVLFLAVMDAARLDLPRPQ